MKMLIIDMSRSSDLVLGSYYIVKVPHVSGFIIYLRRKKGIYFP